MSELKKIIELEKKINALEAQIEFINQRFGLVPDQQELERVIDQAIDTGDMSAFDLYLKRGGILPPVSVAGG
ncbi:MAG: hypothetical protein ABFD79_02770 [Phycisphaerales bacterium]